jgi:nucleoside-diphosphate-sugar epimerase
MPDPDFNETAVLVTGGAGFIGSHLVDALVRRGAGVRVLDNFATGSRENLAQCLAEIELVEGDIRDRALCQKACSGIDLVFHQAALGSVPRSIEDPVTTLEANVMGTANILDAARTTGVGRVVYASSSSVYGSSDKLPKAEGEEGEPLSPYALSKRMGEDLAVVFSRGYGLETVGLRYFNVYGPRQDPAGPYAAVIPRFFRSCLDGDAPVIFGDGEQSRDFTFVTDAVRANLLAAGSAFPADGRAYNVAAGQQTTINELARLVGQISGSDAEPVHEPERPGDVRHSLADLTRVATELGYRAETGLRVGLEASLDYYRSLFE